MLQKKQSKDNSSAKGQSSFAANIINNFKNSSDAKNSVQLASANSQNNYVITRIPISKIKFNSYNVIFNANDSEDEIESLADDIKDHGLYNPVILNHDAEGNYTIICGERRTKAFIFNREKALKDNPNLEKTEWDTIPANVREQLPEYEIKRELIMDNIQSRVLTSEQRYRILFEFIDYCENELNGNVPSEKKEQMLKDVNASKKMYYRIKKTVENASDEDIQLYKDGKITFKEFKARTDELVKKQNILIASRNNIIAQTATPKSYYDEETDSVFFIEQTSDSLTNEITYCTFCINAQGTVPIHRPELGEYSSKSLAQVDLDRYASNNLLPEYTGNFSEYSKASENDSIDDLFTDENKSSEESSPALTLSSEFDNNDESELSNNNEPDIAAEKGTDYQVESHSDNEPIVKEEENNATIQPEPDENATEHLEQMNILENENPEEVHQPSPHNETTVQEPPKKGDIAHFEGININGLSVQGALFAAPSGRTYIISNISLKKKIGDGKFEAACTAEEVLSNTVKRIDDV